MNFPIPTIHTITTVSEAVDAGCDCVMLKRDGWPVAVNCAGSEAYVYSELTFGKAERTPIDRFTPIEPFSALFVGARTRTDLSPTTYLYDMWWADGNTIKNESYRSRYVMMKWQAKKLGTGFDVVHPMPVSATQALWQQCTREGHKGLVFRRSRDTSAGDLYVVRHYAELPRELS